MNVGIVKQDAFGDFIKVFDPDMDFQRVKFCVHNCRSFSEKIVDCGINFVEVHDKEYIEGSRVSIAFLCEVGESGFGTIIKMRVKNVEYSHDGEIRSFLSYEALNNFLNSVVSREE